MVLDKFDFEKEMYNILSDTDTYKELTTNRTSMYKSQLVALINKGFDKCILNRKEKECLIPHIPRIPTIYYLPKVHKNPMCPPGRPIVSGIDLVTSRIGWYMDFYL